MQSVNGHRTRPLTKAVIELNAIQPGLTLTIIPASKDTLHQLIDPSHQELEPEWQLFEGCFYEYKLSDQDYQLSDAGGYGIVQPSKVNNGSGRIATNIYTGTIEISVEKRSTVAGDYAAVGCIRLEIQSLKTGYREDYRSMLEFITEKCTDLVMQSNKPTSHYFEPVYGTEEEKQRALYQRFAFIKSVIDTDDFAEAVHRVITRPVTRWSETSEPVDIRRVRRFSRNNLREVARTGNRSDVPENHYLKTRAGIHSVPTRITSSRKVDSFDTPENRFVKHALETFLHFCTVIHDQAGSTTGLRAEAKAVMVRLESFLHHSLFREISRAVTLPLNSPVLQRKGGYREVLRTWLMFDLAAKLVWKGGDDVYAGRKKDVAKLYEYWLFFHLLDVLETVFEIKAESFDELVEVTGQGLDIKLREGWHIPLYGVHKNGYRNLNIRFSYNRSFRGQTDFMKSKNVAGEGSWTATMRPDYTLSMWPESISEADAERNELIVHIHFDAKYKVENMLGLLPGDGFDEAEGIEIERFEIDGLGWDQICSVLIKAGYAKRKSNDRLKLNTQYWMEDGGVLEGFTTEQHDEVVSWIESQLLSEEKQDQRKGTYRNADLLKMHAYKDAIRRTGGAYVLYPGVIQSNKPSVRRGFHEIIPGLGAFAVSPSAENGGTDALRQFIVDVRDLFINRISQREKMALHTKHVHRKPSVPDEKLKAALPEFLDETELLNPDEVCVLVGYYRSKKQLEWIERTGQYNFRADSTRDGSFPMNARTAGARYLLLHGDGNSPTSKLLYKLTGEGPYIMTRAQLEAEGYPHRPDSSANVYYVYKSLLPAKDDEFAEVSIDVTKLPGYKPARISIGRPLTVTLTELMAAIDGKSR